MHNYRMRLTNSTQLRSFGNGKYIAIYDAPIAPARISAAAKIVSIASPEVFSCGWQYEVNTEDGIAVESCRAQAVGFDNGFMCLAGHEHRTDCEYYTEEEMRGTIAAGHPIAPNARLV